MPLELRVFVIFHLYAASYMHGKQPLAHGVLGAVAQADVPTVLSYRWNVVDDSALRFAQVLYQTLCRTFSLEEAVLEARIAVAKENVGEMTKPGLLPFLCYKIRHGFSLPN